MSLAVTGPKLETILEYCLQTLYRKVSFREKQVEVITRALQNKSLIALLPTGAGKSITYQLPALLQNGTTIVVEPITSLMKDQEDNLRKVGISSIEVINSLKTRQQKLVCQERFQSGKSKFIFLSPERFMISAFRETLEKLGQGIFVNYLVIDEAHCVSEWGHDFRTAYLSLGRVCRKYCRHPGGELPVLALTGTASRAVLKDVQIELDLEGEGDAVIKPERLERKNLRYSVIPIGNLGSAKYKPHAIAAAKRRDLPECLASILFSLDLGDIEEFQSSAEGCGLVFYPHVDGESGVETNSDAISHFPGIIESKVGHFHARLEKDVKLSTQNAFIQGHYKLLNCTKAFGMGIDKPDVRFTIHFNIPASLESLYQEAGRAGRDGAQARCCVMFCDLKDGKHTFDYGHNKQFFDGSFPGQDVELSLITELLTTIRRSARTTDRMSWELNEAFAIDEEAGAAFRCVDSVFDGKRKIFINSADFPKNPWLSVQNNELNAGPNYGPQEQLATEHAIEWAAAQPKTSLLEWLDSIAHYDKPGIEIQMDRAAVNENIKIPIPFDTQELHRIAEDFSVSFPDIGRDYFYSRNAEQFADKLKDRLPDKKLSPEDRQRLLDRYVHIRIKEQTFRVIHRLTALGIVADYTIDYCNEMVECSIAVREPGYYVQMLERFMRRYSPIGVDTYMAFYRDSDLTSEIRKAVATLLKFIYERIGERRETAMQNVEQYAHEGINDENKFNQLIAKHFDSDYTETLSAFEMEYSLSDIYSTLADLESGVVEIDDLLGGCNRLLEDYPRNGAFHILKSVAQSFQQSSDELISQSIESAWNCFSTDLSLPKQDFSELLFKILESLPVKRANVTPFLVHILDDHINSTRTFLKNQNV